ncbi:hypothetical protein X975_05588, partial [Stegodyphus mimosarum]
LSDAGRCNFCGPVAISQRRETSISFSVGSVTDFVFFSNLTQYFSLLYDC